MKIMDNQGLSWTVMDCHRLLYRIVFINEALDKKIT